MTRFHPVSIRTTLSTLLLAAAIAVSVPVAQDQEMQAVAPPYWTTQFPAQMNTVLGDDDPAVQQKGLATLLVLMSQKTPHIQFRSLAPAVMRIFLDHDAPDGVRIMALSALDGIDSPGGYESLMEWARTDVSSSERLRLHVLVVLRTYQVRHGIA